VTIVSEGLAPGERVVTSNQYRLQAGIHVRTAAAEASASGPPAAKAS
jgi:hypothetical protein